VQVLPGVKRPMLLGFQTQEIAQLISIEPVDVRLPRYDGSAFHPIHFGG
jgi:hypothetical protein